MLFLQCRNSQRVEQTPLRRDNRSNVGRAGFGGRE